MDPLHETETETLKCHETLEFFETFTFNRTFEKVPPDAQDAYMKPRLRLRLWGVLTRDRD